MIKEGDSIAFIDSYVPVSLQRKWIVLYFYPKDFTPGCTREAQEFRDHHESFAKDDVEIVGVSVDSEELHAKFKDRHRLNFNLISDKNRELVKLFGVEIMGKAKRTTFLIDSDRIVRKVWQKVSVKEHAEEVLKIIKELKK